MQPGRGDSENMGSHDIAEASLAYVHQPFTDQVVKDVSADSRCYIMAVYARLKNQCSSPIPAVTLPVQPQRSFLTLDIETLGLMHQKPVPPITCVCMYDGVTRYSYLLYGVSAETYAQNREAILQLLDGAERLAGYNAVRFDLPYLALEFGVERERLESWQTKCVDPYIGLKSALHCTSKLQALLDANDLGSKTGCGGNAIVLATEGKYEELLDYCMTDVLLTHELCLLDIIKVNDTHGIRLTPDYKWQRHSFKPPVNVVITMDDALTDGDCYSSHLQGFYATVDANTVHD